MPFDLLSMGLFAAMALAEPDKPEQEPDIELFEFIGSWETTEGAWADPAMWEQELPALPQTGQTDDSR